MKSVFDELVRALSRHGTILDEIDEAGAFDGKVAELYCRQCNRPFVEAKRSYTNEQWGNGVTCGPECYEKYLDFVRKGAPERVKAFLEKLSPEQQLKYLPKQGEDKN